MSYKAFVAATVKDLGSMRTYVVNQLRKCGIVVDPMKDWPADPSDPAKLSMDRTKGCHLCIALVAFQRGTIAQGEIQGRSITQLEIESAAQNGATVLVFMLEDTPSNRTSWRDNGFPMEYATDSDQQFQNRLIAWRTDLQTRMTCEFFQADTHTLMSGPDVIPAVFRQIQKWESRKRLRLLITLLSLFFLLLLTVLAFASSSTLRSHLLSRFVAYHDPAVFSNARNGQYHVVRLVDGTGELKDDTNFNEEILATKKSFKMFANTFWTFQEYERTFATILEKGAEVKIIVTDFSEAGRSTWKPFHDAIGNIDPQKAEAWARANTYDSFSRMARKYPNFKFRTNRQAMLYGMWLRDDLLDSALGHWRLNYYKSRNVSDWPCFRVSNISGSGQITALRLQYDSIWENSVEYQPDNE